LSWEDSSSITLDVLYIQFVSQTNHSIFHTFLTQEKAVHTVPLRIHEDPAQYRIYAYGLKQEGDISSAPYYVVQNAAHSSLDSLLSQGM